MAEKTNGKNCSTCEYYGLLKGECYGKEWHEIAENEKVGGDDCKHYSKDRMNTYANRHLEYIKENEAAFYEDLLIQDKLETYLIELGKRAKETLFELEDAEKKKNPCPYDINDTLKVAGYNNDVHHRMEEIVLKQIVLTV